MKSNLHYQAPIFYVPTIQYLHIKYALFFMVPLGKFQYNSEKTMALLMLFQGSKGDFKKYEVQ